jgi:hypothetical protein
MTCYIVSFEVAKEETRSKVTGLLKTFSGYCPINRTCWAILSDKKASELRDTVAAALETGDRLFIVRSGTAAAWRNSYGEKNSAWLKKNL